MDLLNQKKRVVDFEVSTALSGKKEWRWKKKGALKVIKARYLRVRALIFSYLEGKLEKK